MKKVVLFVLVLVLLFCSACGKKAPEESEPDPSSTVSSETAPEPPAPAPVEIFGKIINVEKNSYANVRSGPGTEKEVIGKAFPDESYKMDLDGSTEDWKKIDYNGRDGYVFKDYIQQTEQ